MNNRNLSPTAGRLEFDRIYAMLPPAEAMTTTVRNIPEALAPLLCH